MEEPVPPPVADAPRALWAITAGTVTYKVLAGAASTGVAILTARQLGPGLRGVMVLLLTISSLALLFCSMGMNISSRIHLVGDNAVASRDFSGLILLLAAFQASLCTALAVILLPLVDVRLSWGQLFLFGLYGGFLLAPFLANAAMNAYGYNTAAAAVDAIGSTAQLAGVLGVFAAGAGTVDAYLWALVAGNALQLLVSVVFLARKRIDLRPRFRPRAWTALIRTGLPAIALDLGQILTFKLDRYLLAAFLDPGAVGIYSVAATAPELLRLPTVALAQPIFYRLASGSARIADFRRARRLMLAATGAMAAATFIAAPFAVRILFGDQYEGAITPLRILLLAEFGITVFYLDASSLAAGLHRVGDAAKAALVGLVLVAVGDVILIPQYGIAGAAWASVVAYTAMGVGAQVLLRRREALLPGGGPPGDAAVRRA